MTSNLNGEDSTWIQLYMYVNIDGRILSEEQSESRKFLSENNSRIRDGLRF